MTIIYRLSWRQRLLLLLLCGWVVGMLPLPASAQTSTSDLATYEQWLREARIAAQRNDRLGLEQVAAHLVATTAVMLPDETTVPVNNQWLREALDVAEPDLQSIDMRLGALLDALAQPDLTAPDDARQQLRTILSRPPFATAEAGESGLIASFFEWVLRMLARLFDPVTVGANTGQAITWIFACLGGVLIIGVLVYLLRGMQFSLTREAQVANETDDPEANLTANTARQQAVTLARGGDYRTAVRYLYISSLLWLDEHRLLRYDRALTNREYLELLRDNAELRADLSAIIDTFDRVWYGHASLDDEGFTTYRQQVDSLRRSRG